MKTITEAQLLMERIEYLQIKQDFELRQLKSKVHGSVKQLNPFSLLFNSISTPQVKSNLLNTVLNITTRNLSQNIIFGILQKPINRLFGNLLQRFIK